jgi:4,5-dihydroxyphthalate decarboxylase
LTGLPLVIGCGHYPWIEALDDGSEPLEGIAPTWELGGPQQIFPRMVRDRAFDVSEIGIVAYLHLRSLPDPPFIALPVFPSRMFRHSYIWVHESAGVQRPADLRGKEVGLGEYWNTAGFWQRAILAHEYGVQPSEIRWRRGRLTANAALPPPPPTLGEGPPGVEVQLIPSDETLDSLLARGAIAALLGPEAPPCVAAGAPGIRRLFPDSRAVEEDYYRRTRIFPIMHVVVIKEAVYRAHPWVATSLYRGFCAAKAHAEARLSGPAPLHLPWAAEEIARARAVLGDDLLPYGVETSRPTLEALLQYAHEQGITARRLTVDELFAPNALDEGRE